MKHLTASWARLTSPVSDVIERAHLTGSLTRTALDKTRLGHCYELSYRYATGHPGWTLVHGSIQGYDNPRIGHGFCLSPDESHVYEPATDQVYDKRIFDATFNPTYDDTFDFESIMRNSLMYGHYGPWGEAEGLHP